MAIDHHPLSGFTKHELLQRLQAPLAALGITSLSTDPQRWIWRPDEAYGSYFPVFVPLETEPAVALTLSGQAHFCEVYDLSMLLTGWLYQQRLNEILQHGESANDADQGHSKHSLYEHIRHWRGVLGDWEWALPWLDGAEKPHYPQPNMDPALCPGANLNGMDLRWANLRNANLTGTSLKNCNLTGAVLNHAILVDTHFDNATLCGAHLRGAQMDDTVFDGADLRDAQMRWGESTLNRASFVGSNLLGVLLMDLEFNQCNFTGATLNHQNLHGVYLDNCAFDKAQMMGCDAENKTLIGCSFRRTNLLGANLEKADLFAAQLQGADLRYARLVRTHLRQAHLHGAWLTGSDPYEANLQHAHLNDATLGTQAIPMRLDEALIHGTDFTGVDLTDTAMEQAIRDAV